MDFTAFIPLVQNSILLVVGGLTALAVIKLLPVFAIWAYNQVIVWFGKDELGKIIDKGDKDAYVKYKKQYAADRKKAAYQRRTEERGYQRYKERRARNDRYRDRYNRGH